MSTCVLVCLCKYLTLPFKFTGRDCRIYPSTFRVVCHSTPKNSLLPCSALKPSTMTMITLTIDGVTDVATVALSCQPSELHLGQGPMWPSHNIGTLVKFQRWMKWRATSRAAFPWTTEPISCQGIRGVEYLSIKSARGARQGPITKFSAREQKFWPQLGYNTVMVKGNRSAKIQPSTHSTESIYAQY